MKRLCRKNMRIILGRKEKYHGCLTKAQKYATHRGLFTLRQNLLRLRHVDVNDNFVSKIY